MSRVTEIEDIGRTELPLIAQPPQTPEADAEHDIEGIQTLLGVGSVFGTIRRTWRQSLIVGRCSPPMRTATPLARSISLSTFPIAGRYVASAPSMSTRITKTRPTPT